MLTDALLALALGWILMSLAFSALWWVQRRTRDAGVVDAGWAYGIGALAVFYAAMLDGPLWWRALVAGLCLLWSLRLGTYLLLDRVLKGPEDGRYAELRRSWGHRFQRRIFWFFQAQAAADSLLSIPILLVLAVPDPRLSTWVVVGLLVVVGSVIGESLADRQLAAFRALPENRGKTCRRGLWRFSRHPNYFFEWIHWMAYPCLGVGLLPAYGWPLWLLTFASAAVLLFLICRVTGIPPTEAQALRSRGEDYRRYQSETSAFFPWFPKARRSD